MKNHNQNTNFTERVKEVVKSIPSGQTLSYKAVATKAGREEASRLVARIMSQNFDKAVPCHRVIRSDGTLGGYNRGGESIKRKILLKEGYIPK